MRELVHLRPVGIAEIRDDLLTTAPPPHLDHFREKNFGRRANGLADGVSYIRRFG